MNEYRHFNNRGGGGGRGRGNYQHGNNYRNQLPNNIYGNDVRRCNPNHFTPLLPFPPFRESRPRWQRPPQPQQQQHNWRGPPQQRLYPYIPPYSPTKQQRPMSPLPGSEEARQKAIAEASARIKQQLNLSSEGDINNYEQCNTPGEQNSIDDCIILNESPEPKQKQQQHQEKLNKRKPRKSPNNTTTIEELRKKILTQFTYMSKGKIQNLVNNPGSTRYDNALQHLVRDMRLHLSSELRNMYTNRDNDPTNEHNKMIDHFNSIVPDLGIELVSLPDTMVAELSKILQFDVNNEIEDQNHQNEDQIHQNEENVLVEPEDMFKQAEKLLSSTDFLNVSFNQTDCNSDSNSYNYPPPQQQQQQSELNIQENVRFDDDSIVYDNCFYSQPYTNTEQNFTNSFAIITPTVPLNMAVVDSEPVLPILNVVPVLPISSVAPVMPILDVAPVMPISRVAPAMPILNVAPVLPIPNVVPPTDIPLPEIQEVTPKKTEELNLNIPLPQPAPIVPTEEIQQLEEIEQPSPPPSAPITLKSVEVLRDPPVREDSSPFTKKIQQDPIYEDAFKTNEQALISDPQENEISGESVRKNKIQIHFDPHWVSKLTQKDVSSNQTLQNKTTPTVVTKNKTIKTKLKMKNKPPVVAPPPSNPTLSNPILNVTSFLQDVITNNLLELPKEHQQLPTKSDFLDKRNKFISETSCESSKSLTDKNEENVRPFNRTRSHSPYDPYTQEKTAKEKTTKEKTTKSRLSLDERIKEMMKIQESRVSKQQSPEEEAPQPAAPSPPSPVCSRKKRKEYKKRRRIEKKRLERLERIKKIEKEKRKRIEINELKQILKRQQKLDLELNKSAKTTKVNVVENNLNLSAEKPEDDTTSLTSNLLNLNSVTCNLIKPVNNNSAPSKIPIKLISKAKSKTDVVKTELEINSETNNCINSIKIKEEPISEEDDDDNTSSSSNENETETSADNVSDKSNNIIHNLTKDILNPPKSTKIIRHFENIDNDDSTTTTSTNKILETPIKNFKIIVETNPINVETPNPVDNNTEPEPVIQSNEELITEENNIPLIENNVESVENNVTIEKTNEETQTESVNVNELLDNNISSINENNNINEETQTEFVNVNEILDNNISSINETNNINEDTVQTELVDNNISSINEETVEVRVEEKIVETTATVENEKDEKKNTITEQNKTNDKKHSENSNSNNKSSHKKTTSTSTSTSSNSKKPDDTKKHRHGSVDRKKEESSKTSKVHKRSDSKHKTSDSKTSSSHHSHHHSSSSTSTSISSSKQKIITRLLDIDLQIHKLMQEKWNLYKELNLTNLEQLPSSSSNDKHSKVPSRTKDTATITTLETLNISTQTDLLSNTIIEQMNDVESLEHTPKKNKTKEKEMKKIVTTPIKENKNKRKEVDNKRSSTTTTTTRKRKLSESGSSIASSSIHEPLNLANIEHIELGITVSDTEAKKQPQKGKGKKIRLTRNSVQKIEEPPIPPVTTTSNEVLEKKLSETSEEIKHKNLVPKLKINLLNVKNKTAKQVLSSKEDENNVDNKIIKLRSKKIIEHEPSIINEEPLKDSKEDTILIINTRKRPTKNKKPIAKDATLEPNKLEEIQVLQIEENKIEECDEEIYNLTSKRKSKKETTKPKIEEDLKKGGRRRNSRNRSITPSSSTSLLIESKTEIQEVKPEVAKRKKRKNNTEIIPEQEENKKSKINKENDEINKVEEVVQVLNTDPVISSNNNKVTSDEEAENLLGFSTTIDNNIVPQEENISIVPSTNEEITEIKEVDEPIIKEPKELEEIVIPEIDQSIIRKQIKHNRKLNKIVTDDKSTDSIDKLYVEDDLDVTNYDKLMKTCFVQLERINLQLNDEEERQLQQLQLEEASTTTINIEEDNLDDPALINDLLLEELQNNELDLNILNEDVKNDLIPDLDFNTSTLIPTIRNNAEVDVIDENGMFCMGHQKSILDIKIVGDEFFAASEDGTIYKYCLKSGTLQDAYTGHKRAVTCIHTTDGAFLNIDSMLLYSGSLDCTLKCYNIETAEVVHSVAVAQAIQCLDSAWGYIFLGTYEGLLFIYNMKKKHLNENSLTIANATVLMIKATQEGSRQVLILASRKREIMVRDAFTGLLLRTMCEEQKPTIYSLLLDRSMVYCGTSDKGILVLDFNNGQQIDVYNCGKGVVCMLMYRSLLFAGCYDGLIYIYNTRTQKHVCTIPGPGEGMLLSLAICNDVIIAGSKKDHLLKIWKIPQEIFNQIESNH